MIIKNKEGQIFNFASPEFSQFVNRSGAENKINRMLDFSGKSRTPLKYLNLSGNREKDFNSLNKIVEDEYQKALGILDNGEFVNINTIQKIDENGIPRYYTTANRFGLGSQKHKDLAQSIFDNVLSDRSHPINLQERANRSFFGKIADNFEKSEDLNRMLEKKYDVYHKSRANVGRKNAANRLRKKTEGDMTIESSYSNDQDLIGFDLASGNLYVGDPTKPSAKPSAKPNLEQVLEGMGKGQEGPQSGVSEEGQGILETVKGKGKEALEALGGGVATAGGISLLKSLAESLPQVQEFKENNPITGSLIDSAANVATGYATGGSTGAIASGLQSATRIPAAIAKSRAQSTFDPLYHATVGGAFSGTGTNIGKQTQRRLMAMMANLPMKYRGVFKDKMLKKLLGEGSR